MTNAETLLAETKAIAEEQSKPGTFSLLDRLQGRSYPKEAVEVYLDEAAGYEIEKLNDKLATATDPEVVEKLEAELEELRAQAKTSRLTFHLQGISSEDYDSVITDAQEQFPLEYREDRNPITLKLEREVIDSEDRDTYFRIQLWTKYVRYIEDAEGNIDSDVSPEIIAKAQDLLPLAAVGRIHVAIEKLRMITNWMDEVQGADFLVKS